MKYYVYGLTDPRTNEIKYIGKGSGNRMFIHLNKTKLGKIEGNNYTKFNALKEILDAGWTDIAYAKLFETDNEAEAYLKETDLIEKYNTLVPDGWNLLRDNKPPSPSKETRKKIGKTLKGENNPMYGKHHSVETIRKIIQSAKNRKISESKKNP